MGKLTRGSIRREARDRAWRRDNDTQDTQTASTHTCALYRNARGEIINPAEQDGIGCPVCYPPDGRYRADAEQVKRSDPATWRALE